MRIRRTVPSPSLSPPDTHRLLMPTKHLYPSLVALHTRSSMSSSCFYDSSHDTRGLMARSFVLVLLFIPTTFLLSILERARESERRGRDGGWRGK